MTLDLDALEALRLADLVGLYHEAAASMMGVSRATFGRVLAEAHRRVAEALVHGKALRIGGGEVVEVERQAIPCPVHGQGRRRGRCCLCPGSQGDPKPTPVAGIGSPAGAETEEETTTGLTGSMRAGRRALARACRSRVLVPGGRQT